jgi:hypothetical protein
MAQPYRIIDLAQYLTLLGGQPSGNELAEISNAGVGSAQIPIAVLAAVRAPTIVSAGGTFNLGVTNFGDVLVTTTAAVTVQLPDSNMRLGVPASIIANQTTPPNITILPFGAQTIIGLPQLKITNPYGAFTLWPLSGGGWYQK